MRAFLINALITVSVSLLATSISMTPCDWQSSGVIAMLIPYAAEIYPVHLRATGTGMIAAGSKLGGILGATGGVLEVFGSLTLSALYIAVPMGFAAILLL